MQKNIALVRTLCKPFCVYYKPGKNEELLCRGAFVVERLMRAGRRLSVEDKPGRDPDHATIELVIHQVCGACDFREHDCDFAQDRAARPCGGYVFLTELLASGVIATEDIKEEEK
jgi:hypothetical protein